MTLPLFSPPFSAALGAPVLASGGPLDHVLPHRLSFAGYDVSNHLVMMLFAALLMLLLFPLAARSKDRVPRGARNFVEAFLEYLRREVARPALHEHTDTYMPFLWTTFFFILFMNLLGALPIDPLISLVTGHPSHVAGTATGNLSVTAALAVCAFVTIHVAGVKEQGFVHYVKHFAPPVPWPLLILLVPLEILGALVKPFALAIRLFANMIAGHIVLAILLGFATMLNHGIGGQSVGVTIASIAGATFIGLLELFVAFLQAYIFTYLTTLFIAMAVSPGH